MSRRRSVGPVYVEQTDTYLKASSIAPQTTMDSNQMPQSHTPAPQKAEVQFALRVLEELKPLRVQPYIDPGDWKKFGITCGQLGLGWESENGGDFLRLITSEKMQQLASQYEFDLVDDMNTDSDHPFHNSCLVASHLNEYLFSYCKPYYLTEGLNWNSRCPDGWEASQLRYMPDEEQWMVEYILSVRGSDLPHVNGTLIEADDLKEDKLMFSEVWCILVLTHLFFRNPGNEKYNVVPVTVVTISGTTFRLVQAFIDGEAGVIRINKSNIVPIGLDKKTAREKMMLIVRWLLAEPVWPSKS
ncbi:hypothetical protein F4859DRAFT_493026 [Xylaria cf. heliscus]|nr:hypothetical protein F4859DRAFT_493026 [Xylaria cf. heliscus]